MVTIIIAVYSVVYQWVRNGSGSVAGKETGEGTT